MKREREHILFKWEESNKLVLPKGWSWTYEEEGVADDAEEGDTPAAGGPISPPPTQPPEEEPVPPPPPPPEEEDEYPHDVLDCLPRTARLRRKIINIMHIL